MQWEKNKSILRALHIFDPDYVISEGNYYSIGIFICFLGTSEEIECESVVVCCINGLSNSLLYTHA